MDRPVTLRALFRFSAKFCVLLLVLAPLWWCCIPGYGWLIVQGCGSVLKWGLGMPVTAGHVEVRGILNTGSLLVFYVGDEARSMKFALLVTNLPPYLALVLATPSIAWRRRLRITLAGAAILVAGHAAYVIAALRLGAALALHDEVSTAASQFFLTLPFLLWIVLAYWGKSDEEDARARHSHCKAR